MSVPCRNWNSKGKHWCWLLGEMTGFLLHSWGLRTLSDCHILGCVLAALAPGDGKPCWAGNLLWCWFRKAMGKILEDAYILIYDQKCLQEENCCTSFTTSVISDQPGGEPGKCRVTGFFILGCAQLLHCGPWERTELWFIIFQLTAKAN